MRSITSSVLSIVALSTVFLISSCSTDPMAEFRMEKKYWDEKDYDNAITQIVYRTPKDEKFPCYAIPAKKAVFLKLIDVNNFLVVLDDNALGLKHREEYSQQMFDHYRDIDQAYKVLDNQDKYVYPSELVDIMKFGLELQLHYFKLGNENVLKESDNPNSEDTKETIKSNEQTILGNYDLYLDFVNKESSLSAEATTKYCEGMDKYFGLLLQTFPNADYSEMQVKAIMLSKKAQSKEIQSSLDKLIKLLGEKTKKPEAPVPAV